MGREQWMSTNKSYLLGRANRRTSTRRNLPSLPESFLHPIASFEQLKIQPKGAKSWLLVHDVVLRNHFPILTATKKQIHNNIVYGTYYLENQHNDERLSSKDVQNWRETIFYFAKMIQPSKQHCTYSQQVRERNRNAQRQWIRYQRSKNCIHGKKHPDIAAYHDCRLVWEARNIDI